MNSRDVANFKAFFKKRGYTPVFKLVTSSVALENAGAEIVSSDSLPVSEILEYMMLWSDNVLADRLAKLASKRAGNAFSEEGIAVGIEEGTSVGIKEGTADGLEEGV